MNFFKLSEFYRKLILWGEVKNHTFYKGGLSVKEYKKQMEEENRELNKKFDEMAKEYNNLTDKYNKLVEDKEALEHRNRDKAYEVIKQQE